MSSTCHRVLRASHCSAARAVLIKRTAHFAGANGNMNIYVSIYTYSVEIKQRNGFLMLHRPIRGSS